MERFVVIVKGFQPLTIITKRPILDVETALDLPLKAYKKNEFVLGVFVDLKNALTQ